jgi:hypothetical protein
VFAPDVRQPPEPLVFSNDGQFFTFLFDNNHIYVADVVKQKVTDICLALTGHRYLLSEMAWSPGGHQLALHYADAIAVYDLDTATFYKISDVPGQVVAWGAVE